MKGKASECFEFEEDVISVTGEETGGITGGGGGTGVEGDNTGETDTGGVGAEAGATEFGS